MQDYSRKYFKWKRRLGTVLGNSARSIVPLGLNSLISLVVIRYSSFSVWGDLVSFLLIINLGVQFFGWGSKQYLLREFASNPAKTGSVWFENLKARFPLLIFVTLIIMLIDIPPEVKTLMILWQSIMFFSRSFEVLILYTRRMRFFLFLEIMLSVVFLGALVFFHDAINVFLILSLFTLNEFIRLVVTAIYFRKLLYFRYTISINFKILTASFVFFILGTIGMLQSRLDLYFVALLLPRNELAVYQVLINYILLIQAATGFIIQPFLKEIYRMNRHSLAIFSFKFTFAGFVIAIPVTVLLTIVLKYIYGIDLSWQMSLLAFIYIVPIFYYTIRVYLLYKFNKESLILISGISVLLLSIPLNYYLITMLGLNGALIAGVIGELLSLLFYFYFEKRVGLVGERKSIVNQVELN